MILTILILVFITITAYLLVPTIILGFIKKPISRNIRLLIVIVNGFTVFMAFQLHYFTNQDMSTHSAAPAIIWSVLNNYLIKRKSDRLASKSLTPLKDTPENIHNVLLKCFHRHIKEITITLLSITIVILLLYYNLDLNSKFNSISGTWEYYINGSAYATWTFTDEGYYTYKVDGESKLNGKYKHIETANELILYDNDGTQHVIDALHNGNLLRIQLNKDSKAIYYALEKDG
jgi:intein/homing endonuclease